ncbi:MAG: DUF4272 domain-containing protein [Pseudomonadota bacterium]|nr:DUF4272 domain-containing protein [Pseudomonadota bacterium]
MEVIRNFASKKLSDRILLTLSFNLIIAILCFFLFESFNAAAAKNIVIQSKSFDLEKALPSDEQIQRKKRSELQLARFKIPINQELDFLPSASDILLRREFEVENRAICLIVIALKAQNAPKKLIDSIVNRYDLANDFTVLEKIFLKDVNPSSASMLGARWRFQSAMSLFWALGLVDVLPTPNQIGDIPGMIRVISGITPQAFRELAQLRSKADILVTVDLYYRYHWATHDARENFQALPGGMIESVVYEREFALKWIIDYKGLSWDNIEADLK